MRYAFFRKVKKNISGNNWVNAYNKWRLPGIGLDYFPARSWSRLAWSTIPASLTAFSFPLTRPSLR
jgi:hypothetical protein